MSTVDQLQAAIEHLAMALSLLDKAGASLTAASVDGALMCLKSELQSRTWADALALDYTYLDQLIDATYSRENHAAAILIA